MTRSYAGCTGYRMLPFAAGWLALLLMAAGAGTANALITGGEGNSPVRDPGWPAGAAAIFNHPGAWRGGKVHPSAAASGRPSSAATPTP